MRQRCTDPNHESYHRYGGRGIYVDPRWYDDFWEFVEDMGPKPGPEYTLDRIDNDGPYTPDNCRWATSAEQMASRSNPNRKLTEEQVRGVRLSKESQRQCAIRYGVSQRVVWAIRHDLTYGTVEVQSPETGEQSV